MIQATKEHHLTLFTTDEQTKGLANTLHHMGELRELGIMTDETYFQIHDILRDELKTENILLVHGYIDNREEKGEYAVRVIEFPVKADGAVHSAMITEDEKYFLVTNNETQIEQLIEKARKELKGDN